MPLRSLTGFGLARVAGAQGTVVAEAKALNHRFFDAKMRLPASLGRHGRTLEALAQKRLSRGRVELVVKLEGQKGEVASGPVLDRPRAELAYQQLLELRDAIAPEESVPLSMLASVPSLWSDVQLDQTTDEETLVMAVSEALTVLDDMRKREGAELQQDLAGRIEQLRKRTTEIVDVADGGTALHERMKERLANLEGTDPSFFETLDPQRLAQEVALLVDRSDVSEEVVRLRSHYQQAEHLLAQETPVVGRRLDFLAQEMMREANTMGSKLADAQACSVLIELKAEVERFREQVQNVL